MRTDFALAVRMLLGAILPFTATMMTFGWRWQKRHRDAGIVDVLWASARRCGCARRRRNLSAFDPGGARRPPGLASGAVLVASRAWQRRRRPLNADIGICARLGTATKSIVLPIPRAADRALRPALRGGGEESERLARVGDGGSRDMTRECRRRNRPDRQWSRHRADPANCDKTYRSGLWCDSRHPNYFFEWPHWFAKAVHRCRFPVFRKPRLKTR